MIFGAYLSYDFINLSIIYQSMKTAPNSITLSVNFNQIVDLVKQLTYKEKLKLGEVIRKETETSINSDKILTHIASEKVLGRDWLSKEEDEAWKDL